MSDPDEEPLINPNRTLRYATLWSWRKDTLWPFPINRALRAMEDHLFDTLHLEKGSMVLDAGCGVAPVAIHIAKRGLRVACIDVVDRHISRAKRNIHANGFDDAITVRKMDYHHLDGFADGTFDGAYTMETFVHATDPELARSEFFRVLKPGGSIALYEYDNNNLSKVPEDVRASMEQINKYAAMPSNARFEQGVLQRMMTEVGFEDIELNDLSINITRCFDYFSFLRTYHF